MYTCTQLLTFRIQAVHHGLYNIQFILYGEVDKIGVNQNIIWRSKLSVVLKKQCRRGLFPVMRKITKPRVTHCSLEKRKIMGDSSFRKKTKLWTKVHVYIAALLSASTKYIYMSQALSQDLKSGSPKCAL